MRRPGARQFRWRLIPRNWSPHGKLPTVLRVWRFRFFFFSNEALEPPHVHVADDRRLARFRLEPTELIRSAGYAPHELTQLRALVVENRQVLLEAWHEFFGS